MTPAAPFAALLSVLAFGFAFAAWWRSRGWQTGLKTLADDMRVVTSKVEIHAHRLRKINEEVGTLAHGNVIHEGRLKATDQRQHELSSAVIDHADRLGTAEGRIGETQRYATDLSSLVSAHDDAIAELRGMIAVEAQSPSPVGPPKDYYDPKAAGCCRIAEGETHWIDVESGRTAGGIVLPCEGRPATAADRASRDANKGRAEARCAGEAADYFAAHAATGRRFADDAERQAWLDRRRSEEAARYGQQQAGRAARQAKAAAEDNTKYEGC